MYKIIDNNYIRRLKDGVIIPRFDPNNTDFIEFLALGGNSILQPADPPILRYSEYASIPPVKLTTNNGTTTELVRYTLAARTLYVAHLEIEAINTTDAGIPCRHIEAVVTIKRLNAGALIVGTIAVTIDQPDVAAPMPVSAATLGNDFVIRVTGIAAKTIDWYLSGRIKIVTQDGK